MRITKKFPFIEIIQINSKGEKAGTYKNIAEASRSTGIKEGNISQALDKPGKTAGGYKWTSTRKTQGEFLKSITTNLSRRKSKYISEKERVDQEMLTDKHLLKIAKNNNWGTYSKRTCLSCDHEFMSLGTYNRRCDACTGRERTIIEVC